VRSAPLLWTAALLAGGALAAFLLTREESESHPTGPGGAPRDAPTAAGPLLRGARESTHAPETAEGLRGRTVLFPLDAALDAVTPPEGAVLPLRGLG
jgi:hypothetical protein